MTDAPEYVWVKGELAGKTAAIPPERTLHVIEGAEPRRYKIRMICGLIAGYHEVALRELTEKRKLCRTCEANRHG